MNISKLAVNRPVTAIMAIMVIVLVGAVTLMGLSTDLMPEMELPIAMVLITYPNASPEEVESLITRPVEQSLATVENLDAMFSMSSAGTAMIGIQFATGTDMNFASLDMREKIAMVERVLPDDAATPMVLQMDINATPILAVYVGGDMPLYDLQRLVEDDIGPAMERVGGVASVDISGGVSQEVVVNIQQERLDGYGLSMAQIGQLLAMENMNLPSGDIVNGEREVIVRTLGKFDSLADIESYPLTLPTREVIQIRDIGTVEQTAAEINSINRLNGEQSIAISVTKQSTANISDVSAEVHQELAKLREKYPDLTIAVGFDQADFINSAIESVSTSALIGAVLAAITIFIFLKSLRSTLVVSISIPTSLLATFILMSLGDMTLNVYTLGALTLVVGMLVDNSVVVLENIHRNFQLHDDPKEAAIHGSKEVYQAVIASTLTSVVVFLPIALSGGMAAMLLADFSWTIIIALVASLFVALTAVPLLSSRLMQKSINPDYLYFGTHRYKLRIIPLFTRFIDWLIIQYGSIIRRSLIKRKLVVIISIIVLIASSMLIFNLGFDLMPAMDEGSFAVTIESPYGTSIEERDRIASQIEEYLLAIPELETLTIAIAESDMFSSTNTSTITGALVAKDLRERSTEQVVSEINEQLPQIPGAKISANESSSMMMMMGSGADIEVQLQGPDLDMLDSVFDDLSERILLVDGVSKVTSSSEEGNPELQISVNRNIAAYYGITANQLSSALSNALSGNVVTTININDADMDLRLAINNDYQNGLNNMQQVPITTASGQQVAVGQIAEFNYDNSPTTINRIDQQRNLTLSIEIENRDLASVSTDVMAVIEQYNFPDGYLYDVGGMQEQMMDIFGDLLLALVVAVLLVYMVLASQFESLTLPFIVMMSIPFALSGSFLLLFICGMSFSAPAFAGLIMLVGMVVNNSILLVEFINQNKGLMERDEAIVQAGMLRLRPILITTITTCIGMLPMSLGFGDGGELLAPLAVSIIGGMIGSTLVTMILIPVLYANSDDGRLKREARRQAKRDWHKQIEENWLKEDAAK